MLSAKHPVLRSSKGIYFIIAYSVLNVNRKCEKGVKRMSNLTQWGKEVKKAAIDQDLTLIEVSRKIGISYTLLSALMNGRYAKSNFENLVGRVNEVLGTTGIPPKPTVPSEQWCIAVRKAMLDRKMLVKDLASETGIPVDKVSLVINGNVYDDGAIEAINRLLDIKEPVLSSAVT